MSVTSISAAAWALILDGCNGDVDLARSYLLRHHPFRDGEALGEIEVSGPGIKCDVPVELWTRLMEFFDGNELHASTFLLKPLSHFGYRPLGMIANEGNEGVEVVLNYIGQIEAGVYI